MEVKTILQQEKIVQALLHHGADPFKTDASGRNALILACENGVNALTEHQPHLASILRLANRRLLFGNNLWNIDLI